MNSLINDGFPFDTRMARDLGLSPKDLHHLVRQHHLRRQIRGVYIDAHALDTRESRLAGIRLVAPAHAIVCNESASWLWGVDSYQPSRQRLLEPSLVVPHGATRVTKAGVRCRQAIINRKDVTEIGGVLVTTPVRTASDLLRRLYRPYALAAADGLTHSGLIEPEELWEFTARLKGFPGIIQARTLSLLVEPLTESPGESWQRLRILDAGFPFPSAHHLVVDHHDRERWLDLAYPQLRIGVEYDGREFHTDVSDREHDDERRGYLSEVLGWKFVIGTRERIFGEDTGFERELGALLGMTPRPRFWGMNSRLSRRNSLAA